MAYYEQKIAKITDTFLGFEDHGILTAFVTFDYGSSGQSLGPRSFGSQDESRDPDGWEEAHASGMDYVRRLLLACGVDRWEQLKGRTVLVTASHTDIARVEPLPTERGKTFDIGEWAAQTHERKP